MKTEDNNSDVLCEAPKDKEHPRRDAPKKRYCDKSGKIWRIFLGTLHSIDRQLWKSQPYLYIIADRSDVGEAKIAIRITFHYHKNHENVYHYP